MQIEYDVLNFPKLFAIKRCLMEIRVPIFEVFSYNFSELGAKLCQFSRI